MHALLNNDHVTIEVLINQNKKKFKKIEVHYQDHV